MLLSVSHQHARGGGSHKQCSQSFAQSCYNHTPNTQPGGVSTQVADSSTRPFIKPPGKQRRASHLYVKCMHHLKRTLLGNLPTADIPRRAPWQQAVTQHRKAAISNGSIQKKNIYIPEITSPICINLTKIHPGTTASTKKITTEDKCVEDRKQSGICEGSGKKYTRNYVAKQHKLDEKPLWDTCQHEEIT